MNYLVSLVTLTTIFSTYNVNSLKTSGLPTNITEILNKIALMGSRVIPNYLPDLAFNDNVRHKQDPDAARRYLMRYIDKLEKKIHDNSDEFISNDFTDYDEIAQIKPKIIGDLGEEVLKTINRRFKEIKEKRKERKRAALIRGQHEKRMKEVIDFMKDHYATTSYLLSEIKRIKAQRMVKDPLREMVEYLEDPSRNAIKEGVIKCFNKLRKTKPIIDIWSRHKTNNLVINTFKDPMNYGFMN